jgi:hypothetical protein
MNGIQKMWKWAFLLAVLIVGVQLTVSFALRTKRIHGYLIAHLERAFGRPVEVRQFSAEILPMPRLEMDGITIGEDPAFGREYFLRADRMQAGLRWMGLLKGQFSFGTMSLTRPSLILVRNANGRWNLEDWLPPSTGRVASYAEDDPPYGPQAAASPSNFLQKIEFDDGRISFKFEDEKWPFAFTNVSGDVEQTGPGRWQLNLQAKPWRSGVPLQSTGILYVKGDVAGTSARLQPARVTVHWDKVSLADLFRLATGNDFGVRGEFGLDGTASVGVAKTGETNPAPGRWDYEVQARATQVHRWDLTERNDNPKVSVRIKGVWDLLANEVRSEEVTMELPQSNFHGTGKFATKPNSPWSLHLESAAVTGLDILGWCRAFRPGMAEGVSAEQFFTGSGVVVGWPLRWMQAEISSEGGTLRVPGLPELLRIGAVTAGFHGNEFSAEPVRVTLPSAKAAELNAAAKTEKAAGKPRDNQNWVEVRFAHNALSKNGAIHLDGHLDQADYFFKTAVAFGKTLNHGWELSGGVGSALEWDWSQGMFRNGRWNGAISFSKAELQAAGLNQPIELEDARMEWKDGRRSAIVAKAAGFGATWSGTVGEDRLAIDGELPNWQFRLHADHLDATELDRWVGPRARPNWLQRLLPSLLGNSTAGGKPSELLRRISAEGELNADTVSVEKIRLSKAHAKVSLQDLHLNVREAEAQWVGGNVRGNLQANFAGTPKYEIFAQVDRANLSQLPWLPGWSDRWNGSASGTLRLVTAGVGRDELLNHIGGRGDIEFKNVEFRGWDVVNSLESNAAKTGVSHWTSGEGEFAVKDREVTFDAIQFDEARTKIWLAGSLGFETEMTLAFRSAPTGTREAVRGADVRVLQINGSTETPRISLENISAEKSKP